MAGTAPRPPFDVALARHVTSIPAPDALPGGTVYEPKWDGFRAVLDVRDGAVTLWSRQGKELTRAFPDLVAAASGQLPAGVIVDGEAVVWSGGRLDFDALQRRLVGGPARVASEARARPASFVAFDVLGAAGLDARELPLTARRALLEELASGWSPPLQVSPATTSLAEARQWFEEMASSGIEGLVAKGRAQPYRGGERSWLKIKRRETVDVVLGAVIGERARPSELVVGLPVNGELRIAGRSAPLRAAEARQLGAVLRAPSNGHPWPVRVKPGALSRFNTAGRGDVHLTLVDPIVVEVSTDGARVGESFRHLVRFVRARPDQDVPGQVG